MAYKRLSFYERCKIQAMDEQGYQQKEIAEALGRSPSTISREFKRNKTIRWSRIRGWLYRGDYAQQTADRRQKQKPKPLKFTAEIEAFVREKIRLKWSPEQISGYAMVNALFSISHERIYQFVLADKKNGGELYKNLRQGKKKYRRRYGSGKPQSTIKDKISIDKRPDIINNKERLGDWEIDTIIGQNRSQAIVTVAERISKALVAKKMPNHLAITTAQASIEGLSPYAEYVNSITSDNGLEFAEHKKISAALGTEFYFAHPYSSWERGLNENTNGLLRQYLPKRSDFDCVTDVELTAIVEDINNRPRKTLGYRSPNQVFAKLAA